MPSWGIVGRIVFWLCPFPDESTDVYRIWCQSVHPFGSFPRLKFVTPEIPRNAPCGIEGELYLAMSIPRRIRMYQIWCQSVEPFDSFPRHLHLSPPKTPTMPPRALWDIGSIVGRLVFRICPFPDKSSDANQSWSSRLTASQDF